MAKKNTKIKDDPFGTWLNSLTQEEQKSYSGKYVVIELKTSKLVVSGESFSEVYAAHFLIPE